jgi:hypothetical protein
MRKYPVVCEIHLRLYDWIARKGQKRTGSYRRKREKRKTKVGECTIKKVHCK